MLDVNKMPDITSKSSPFLAPDNPLLSKKSAEVSLVDMSSPETARDIETMLNVAYGEQVERTKPTLVGLAAPQIGISRRIILVDVAADGKGKLGDLRLYINPEIVARSSEENEWYEGCFSTSRVCGIVSRPTDITVRAYAHDSKGEWKPVEEKYSGYTARIFQHEIDHLDGKEFVTHISDDSKLHWVEKEEFPAYRDAGAWRNWPNKCPRDRWERIKGIKK
jgi:peptide deformylase